MSQFLIMMLLVINNISKLQAVSVNSFLQPIHQARSELNLIEFIQQLPNEQIIFDDYALATIYDTVFERYESLPNNTQSQEGLILLTHVIMNQIPIEKKYIADYAWKHFTNVYFYFFADDAQAYLEFLNNTEIISQFAIDNVHTILDILVENQQNISHYKIRHSIVNIVCYAGQQEIVLGFKSYQQIMYLFAKTGDYFSATIVINSMIKLKGIGFLRGDLREHFINSFADATTEGYNHILAQLQHSPELLKFIFDVVMRRWNFMPVLQENHHNFMPVLISHCAKIATIPNFFNYFGAMLSGVQSVQQFNTLLLFFFDLQVTKMSESNTVSVTIVFMIKYGKTHLENITLNLETYQILHRLCKSHKALFDLFKQQNEFEQIEGKEKTKNQMPTSRILGRLQKIEIGKSTQGYKNYISRIAIADRTPNDPIHPQTPNVMEMCSTKRWQHAVRLWRRPLHEYDTENATITT